LSASVTLWEATAPVKLPAWSCLLTSFMVQDEKQHTVRVVFHFCLHHPHKDDFNGSHLSYAHSTSFPGQGVVKLHGVFLSCRG
jgi:kynureninase